MYMSSIFFRGGVDGIIMDYPWLSKSDEFTWDSPNPQGSFSKSSFFSSNGLLDHWVTAEIRPLRSRFSSFTDPVLSNPVLTRLQFGPDILSWKMYQDSFFLAVSWGCWTFVRTHAMQEMENGHWVGFPFEAFPQPKLLGSWGSAEMLKCRPVSTVENANQ